MTKPNEEVKFQLQELQLEMQENVALAKGNLDKFYAQAARIGELQNQIVVCEDAAQPPLTPPPEQPPSQMNLGALLMDLPNEVIERGNLTSNMVKSWNAAGTHRWNRELRDFALARHSDRTWLRAYHEPQSYGTRRCTISHQLDIGKAYRVSWLCKLSNNWEFGGPIKESNPLSGQSGKMGMGLGDNTYLTSGGDINPKGFTCRGQWRGPSKKAYCYDTRRSLVAVGKPDGRAYGDERPLPSYPTTMSEAPLVPGRIHKVVMDVHMNTSWAVADGMLKMWVDDKQIIDDRGLHWMGTVDVAPNIGQSLLTSFHGGSSTAWAPSVTCWADYSEQRVLRLA